MGSTLLRTPPTSAVAARPPSFGEVGPLVESGLLAMADLPVYPHITSRHVVHADPAGLISPPATVGLGADSSAFAQIPGARLPGVSFRGSFMWFIWLLRPAGSTPCLLPTPPRGDAVGTVFGAEPSKCTGGTCTRVDVRFAGARNYGNRLQSKLHDWRTFRGPWREARRRFRGAQRAVDFGTDCHVAGMNFGNYGNRLQSKLHDRRTLRGPWRQARRRFRGAQRAVDFGTDCHVARINFGNYGNRLHRKWSGPYPRPPLQWKARRRFRGTERGAGFGTRRHAGE